MPFGAVVDHPGVSQDAEVDNRSASDRDVIMVLAGGIENGGGIGRMVGYVMTAWNGGARRPMTFIDTRGPKFKRAVWPVYFAKAVIELLKRRPHETLLHIHVAANLSSVRKLVISYIARLRGIAYVMHLHDPKYAEWYGKLPGPARASIRAMFSRASRVIVLGKPAADMVRTVLQVPQSQIVTIANAVSGPSSLPTDRKSAEPLILFLGQLEPRKGVHDLLAALAETAVTQMAWTAVLAGGGPAQPGYEAQAAESGLANRIRFPGWVPKETAQTLLASAAILVLPSYAEEMAMAILEAMAFGLCIIATPVGAHGEVLEHGVSGLFVSPGDVQGLSAALSECIRDPELRQRLGDGARAAYLQRFNIADYPARLEKVYASVGATKGFGESALRERQSA
jgi:glycosyltransferase involved in cell wall biosynthesis